VNAIVRRNLNSSQKQALIKFLKTVAVPVEALSGSMDSDGKQEVNRGSIRKFLDKLGVSRKNTLEVNANPYYPTSEDWYKQKL
jgi:hypothetical protein